MEDAGFRNECTDFWEPTHTIECCHLPQYRCFVSLVQPEMMVVIFLREVKAFRQWFSTLDDPLGVK